MGHKNYEVKGAFLKAIKNGSKTALEISKSINISINYPQIREGSFNQTIYSELDFLWKYGYISKERIGKIHQYSLTKKGEIHCEHPDLYQENKKQRIKAEVKKQVDEIIQEYKQSVPIDIPTMVRPEIIQSNVKSLPDSEIANLNPDEMRTLLMKEKYSAGDDGKIKQMQKQIDELQAYKLYYDNHKKEFAYRERMIGNTKATTMKRESREEESKKESIKRINGRKYITNAYFNKKYLDTSFVQQWGIMFPVKLVRNVDGVENVRFVSETNSLVQQGFIAHDISNNAGDYLFYISSTNNKGITIKSKKYPMFEQSLEY